MASKTGYTKNYSLFTIGPFNRRLRDRPDLRESLRAHGFWSSHPVLVRMKRRKMEIVSGHHRFNEARKLGIGVYYELVSGDQAASPWGVTATEKSWSPADYLTAHAKSGNIEYIALADFIEEHGFALTVSADLLARNGLGGYNSTQVFRSGGFCRGSDLKVADKIVEVTQAIEDINTNGFQRVRKNTRFLKALISMIHVSEFDPDRFVRNALLNPAMLIPQADVHSYMDMIEEIHNHRARTRPPVAHLAREAARARRGR